MADTPTPDPTSSPSDPNTPEDRRSVAWTWGLIALIFVGVLVFLSTRNNQRTSTNAPTDPAAAQPANQRVPPQDPQPGSSTLAVPNNR
ncbi:MAG TPA: hypothetical protein VF669_21455 [Tepidisphaeraceae bacterium]|jgi:hypothetical protein